MESMRRPVRAIVLTAMAAMGCASTPRGPEPRPLEAAVRANIEGQALAIVPFDAANNACSADPFDMDRTTFAACAGLNPAKLPPGLRVTKAASDFKPREEGLTILVVQGPPSELARPDIRWHAIVPLGPVPPSVSRSDLVRQEPASGPSPLAFPLLAVAAGGELLANGAAWAALASIPLLGAWFVAQDSASMTGTERAQHIGEAMTSTDASAREGTKLLEDTKEADDDPCVTPFGTVLGQNSGVVAHSNCNSEYVSSEYHSYYPATGPVRLVRSGLKWQCVEYARRWLQVTRGITFGSIDYAWNIWDLPTFEDLDGRTVSIRKHLNGSAGSDAMPQVGDVVIYEATGSFKVTGHVAIVTGVIGPQSTGGSVESYRIRLSEQNTHNRMWGLVDDYSREIDLKVRRSSQQVQVTMTDDVGPQNGGISGTIIGWIRPMPSSTR